LLDGVRGPQVPHFARANQSISGLGRSPNQ
jgi:hypothetical protein